MDNIIRLWDLGSGNLINSFVGHEGKITSLQFARNGKLLASCGEDDSVRIWNTTTFQSEPVHTLVNSSKKEFEPIKTFYTKQSPVYSLNFSRRNILVALSLFQPSR
jgi:transcription initiation factor TFIID subunit 5